MSGSVRAVLETMIADGVMAPDAQQRMAAQRLDALAVRLAGYAPPKARMLMRLFRGESKTLPRGVYLFGPPGRGKTMLMDLFFDIQRREGGGSVQRHHFDVFMQRVHRRLADIRARQASGEIWENADPVKMVAREIMEEGWLVGIDEFQVQDITDAMMLGRLFDHLFRLGVVLVATSNTPPAELYRDGLNRALFEPFIELLLAHVEIVPLEEGVDHRLSGMMGSMLQRRWMAPITPQNARRFDRQWLALLGTAAETPAPVDLGGRVLMVQRAGGDAARFSFGELCEQPLGAGDYIAIARRFSTIFIQDIPLLGPAERNTVLRFMHLVDALYDNRVRLFATAAGEPPDIYREGPMKEAFARTVSRLQQMRRQEWPDGKRECPLPAAGG